MLCVIVLCTALKCGAKRRVPFMLERVVCTYVHVCLLPWDQSKPHNYAHTRECSLADHKLVCLVEYYSRMPLFLGYCTIGMKPYCAMAPEMAAMWEGYGICNVHRCVWLHNIEMR